MILHNWCMIGRGYCVVYITKAFRGTLPSPYALSGGLEKEAKAVAPPLPGAPVQRFAPLS